MDLEKHKQMLFLFASATFDDFSKKSFVFVFKLNDTPLPSSLNYSMPISGFACRTVTL